MLTLADKYLEQGIKNIKYFGFTDENPRPKYSDGTPAYTKFVTHNVRSYDLSRNQFPICTLRQIAWRSAIKEILWIFQDASNNLDVLHDKYNVHVWDEWESEQNSGTIGYRYGHTVKRYDLFNKRVLEDIKNNPYGRYHVCNLWQEEEFKDGDGLKPCAYETIWTVRGKYLDMLLMQRSGDMLIASGAGNYNEVGYAALLIMVARHTGYEAGKFAHVVANEQIYDRHWDQAEELLNRYTKIKYEENKNKNSVKFDELPNLQLNPLKTNFYNFTIDDFQIVNYEPIKPQLKFDLGI